jgi:hypothetical protein
VVAIKKLYNKLLKFKTIYEPEHNIAFFTLAFVRKRSKNIYMDENQYKESPETREIKSEIAQEKPRDEEGHFVHVEQPQTSTTPHFNPISHSSTMKQPSTNPMMMSLSMSMWEILFTRLWNCFKI